MARWRSKASALVILGVSFGAVGAHGAEFDWRQHAGSTINVALARQPWSDFITPLIPEFEELTGIQVELEVLPEDQHRQKLAVAFTAGRGDIDVFGSQRHQEGVKYHRAGWYEILNDEVDDPSRTAPGFDFGDIAPQALSDVTVAGDLVGIPLYTEVQIFFYRKDLFEEAGLEFPDTFEELESAAAALTNRDAGVSGLCLRGKGAATTTIFSGFLHGMGGSWADENGDPALTSPAALKAFDYYGRLAREYGPPGVTNYHWFQCSSLFASGRAAMWTDSNIFAGGLIDPDASQVADQVGFAVFPAGPGGRKPAGGGWFLAISAMSENKGPAWYFLQWATGKENALKAQLAGIPTARLSAWESEDVMANTPYPGLMQATLDTLKLEDTPSWGPPWVAVGEIRDVLGAAVITAILGGDIEEAANQAVEQIQVIRARTE